MLFFHGLFSPEKSFSANERDIPKKKSPFFLENKKQKGATMHGKPGKTIILYNQSPKFNSQSIKLFWRGKVQKQNFNQLDYS